MDESRGRVHRGRAARAGLDSAQRSGRAPAGHPRGQGTPAHRRGHLPRGDRTRRRPGARDLRGQDHHYGEGASRAGHDDRGRERPPGHAEGPRRSAAGGAEWQYPRSLHRRRAGDRGPDERGTPPLRRRGQGDGGEVLQRPGARDRAGRQPLNRKMATYRATPAVTPVPITVTVNGLTHRHAVEPRPLLVYYLRETLGLTRTPLRCDPTSCGTCTVVMNALAVKSCTILAAQADGADILTVEGLARDGQLHPIQEG